MSRAWALQDAKNRFSEVVDRARDEGPQVVTRRGAPVAVVVSVREYQALTGSISGDFVEFLLSGPRGSALRIERDRSPGRRVDLE